jgi:hypothetical protein
MAFEKVFQNTYHELEQQTKYRFAELELGKSIHQLTTLYRHTTTPRAAAHNLLTAALVQTTMNNRNEEDFIHMLSSTYTLNPPKVELIHYLIIHGHSYNKIRELTKASFNTIAKMRYGLPIYYPTFPNWDEDMLAKWDRIKTTLNLFDEELAHLK